MKYIEQTHILYYRSPATSKPEQEMLLGLWNGLRSNFDNIISSSLASEVVVVQLTGRGQALKQQALSG